MIFSNERSRPSPPATKYVLEEPKIARLSPTLGIPGYFPHAGKGQDEEKMSLLNVVNGYHHPLVVDVCDVF